MVDASLKSTEKRDELSTTCQYACQHLMLHKHIIPCFRTFREAFSHPYISFFHLLVIFLLYTVYTIAGTQLFN